MRAWVARWWVPVALGLVFVALLPGVLLLLASLFGYEADANAWLEQLGRLGYHLPVPWWAGLLALLIPLLLVLLYFLKLKRQALAVPSTFLWKKSIEDLRVNSLFQWLRNNILLLLQLLVALALIYALLGPRWQGQTATGVHYILMLDNSASMSARDGTPTRLEAAKMAALARIEQAGEQDSGMVLVFNSSAEIRQSYTTSKTLLRQAVAGIEPTARPTRIDEALALADSLANPTRSTDNEAVAPANAEPGKERTYVAIEGVPTEVHLYSDGRFADVPEFALGNLQLTYHVQGATGAEKANNLAIVGCSASRDETDARLLNVFARVLNFRPTDSAPTLRLEVLRGGQLQKVYERTLRLPARKVEKVPGTVGVRDVPGEAVATFELPDFDDRTEATLHLRLVNPDDVFALDDDAWLVIAVPRRMNVLIATPGNPILKAFFDDPTTQAVAAVTTLPPASLSDAAKYVDLAREGQFDLCIFDRCAPANAEQMPRGHTLFIGAVPPGTVVAAPPVKTPFVKGWQSASGPLRGLTGLHEVTIGEALRVVDLPPRTPKLLEGEQGLALMFTLQRGAYTDVVQTFALLDAQNKWNTMWPLNPSFPLYLRNVLYTYGNLSESAASENVQPGQVKLLRLGASVKSVTITPPSGSTSTLERGSRPEFAYAATEQPGVYGAAWGERAGLSFAVNLLDSDESQLEPRAEVRFGAQTVQGDQTPTPTPRELWPWLVAAGLGLLLLEWYIYNRRVRL